MNFDYLKSSMDRAQREYDNQTPRECERRPDDNEKEFDKHGWLADIEHDDN